MATGGAKAINSTRNCEVACHRMLEHQIGWLAPKPRKTRLPMVPFRWIGGERTRFDYQGKWRFGGESNPQALTWPPSTSGSGSRARADACVCAKPGSRQRQDWLAANIASPAVVDCADTVRPPLHHELFNDATTYRVTAAQPLGQTVKLRAVWDGIANRRFSNCSASFLQLRPQPELEAGESRASTRRDFAIGDRGRLSLTYFNVIWKTRSQAPSTRPRSLERHPLSGKSSARVRNGSAVFAEPNTTVWMRTPTRTRSSPMGNRVRLAASRRSAAITYALPGSSGAITLAVDHNGRQEDLNFRTFNAHASRCAITR